ncbi:hypothetical protein HZA75_03560 [Candidatus Roizmanbacteria bacterium]|nr:hypothetical protein [Candidatus Roizmanbacteria bacterium]
MQYFSQPKVQLAFCLLIFILSYLLLHPSINIFVYYCLTIGLAIGLDYFFHKIRGLQSFFPSAAGVSGLIIGLLNSPSSSIFSILLVVALAILSKHFLRIKNRHIFNPAAFGLFFGSWLFKTSVSWWGVASGLLPLLLLTGYVSIFKSKKLNIILSFFVVYNLLTFFINKRVDIFDPVIIFFTLVMLPEPMTSSIQPNRQILFGTAAAVLTLTLSYLVNIPDVLTGSLLIANLLFFKFR